jgi:hypothetical protein
VEVIRDEGNSTHVPKITYRDFHADREFAGIEIREALREMMPGQRLIHGYNLIRTYDTNWIERKLVPGFQRFHWMIALTSQVPHPNRYYFICGRERRFPRGQGRFSILFVQSAQEIMEIHQ